MKKLYLLVLIFALVHIACEGEKELSADQAEVSARQPVIPVVKGKPNNVLLEISLQVKDSSLQQLTAFDFDFSGSSQLSDLSELEVFYLPQEEAQPVLFGRASDESSEQLQITGQFNLKEGTHRFVLQGLLEETSPLTNSIAVALSKVSFNGNESLSTIENTGKPQRTGHLLRSKNQEGVHTTRIPGLATTDKGTLIAVYDNRYDKSSDLQGDIDVGMSRSTDGGESWEEMKVIMDMGTFGGRPEDENGIGDPAVLFDPATNTIWVAALWLSGKPGEMAWHSSQPGMEPHETGQFVLVKSEDDGQTWSEPKNITSQVKKPEWRLFFNGPGKGISMKDGTLVFPAQFRDADGIPHSTIIYSKDAGESWKVGEGAKPETTEAQVVELLDGSLMLNMRDNRNHPNNELHDGKHGRSVAVTTDLGQTWVEHPTSREALPESTCMASLITQEVADHGQVLFFSNPNSTSNRAHMTIKASLDQGNSWKEAHQLELYEPGGFGYSCLTTIDDEHIGILYEGARDLYFQKIPIADLLD